MVSLHVTSQPREIALFLSVLSSFCVPVSAKQNIPSPRTARSGEHASHTTGRTTSSLSYRVRRVRVVLESISHWSARPQKFARKRMAKLRKALPLALDRGTMTGVLLQKQARPAAALLPHWLSGYSFLLTVETTFDRARVMGEAWATSSAAGTAALPSAPSLQVPQPRAAGVCQ
jgi:hypothetical protein